LNAKIVVGWRRITVNDKLVGICEAAVMTTFEALSQHSAGGTEESTKTLNNESRSQNGIRIGYLRNASVAADLIISVNLRGKCGYILWI